MPWATFVSTQPFRSWLRRFFAAEWRSGRRRCTTPPRRLCLEGLEQRLVPATLTNDLTNTVITLTLDTLAEVVTISATATGYNIRSNGLPVTNGLTGGGSYDGAGNLTPVASVVQLDIADSGTATSAELNFQDSDGNAYVDLVRLGLTNGTANFVEFSGTSTFDLGLTTIGAASTNDGIILIDPGARVAAAANQDITLIAALDDISLAGSLTTTGTGSVFLEANNLLQDSKGIITSASTATFDINAIGGDILLDAAANNITAPVTIAEVGGGSILDLQLRNVHPNAQIGTLTGPTLGGGTINNLTLIQDNNGLSGVFSSGGLLPAVNIAGNINIQVAGPIGEAADIIATGGGTNTFTVFGNFGITLDSPTNDFAGPISLNNPAADATATSAVVLHNSNGAGVTLADSHLGHATLFVQADDPSGTINQSGPVIQKPGAGDVTIVAGGSATSMNLNDPANQFTGKVILGGLDSLMATSVTFANNSPLAAMDSSKLVLPGLAADDTLTIIFGSAPAVLPGGLGLDTLTVTAQGILQANPATSALTVATATFTAGSFPIILDHAGNDFTDISVNNSGPNDVIVADGVNGINFLDSSVGSGRLSVTSTNGDITQSGGTGILQDNAVTAAAVGPAIFDAGADAIDLSTGTNRFRGALTLTGGSTGVSVSNDIAIVLGNVNVTNAADLTVTGTGSGSLTQAPGTAVVATGAASFDMSAGSDITLDNLFNTFAGAVAVNGANARLRDSDSTGLILAASTVAGDLTVTAAGTIIGSDILQVTGIASFDAGSGNITLNSANVLNTVALKTRAQNGVVSVQNTAALDLGNIKLLGTTTLSVVAAGTITDSGAIEVADNVTLDSGLSGDVFVDGSENNIGGTIGLNATVDDLVIANQGDITFAGSPTFQAGSVLSLTAGGTITLPNLSATPIDQLTVTAGLTKVAGDITTTSGSNMVFTGAVDFTGTTAKTLDAGAGSIFFNGDVTTAGDLNVASGFVGLNGGVFDLGDMSLTIAGGMAIGDFDIGTPARVVGRGTITLTGMLSVRQDGTLEVGGTSGPDTLTIANGAGTVFFNEGSTLLVGLQSAGNDKLLVTGVGNVALKLNGPHSPRLLSSSGLAPTTNSPVLQLTGGGNIVDFTDTTKSAHFVDTVDANGNPIDFFTGTDIVTPTYSTTDLQLKRGGTPDSSGTFSVSQTDSDKVTVTTAKTNGLAHVVDANGRLAIVLRSAASTVSNTVTVTTTKSVGDGFAELAGIAVNGLTTGSVTIKAATANVAGSITVDGRLASLTVRDAIGTTIKAGTVTPAAATTPSTTITGRIFNFVDIDLLTTLSALTLKEFLSKGTITADHFGTIKTTGDKLAGIAGDFDGKFINRSSTGPALASLSVAGDLAGLFDLRGSVGSITAHTTAQNDDFSLGRGAGATVANGGLLGNITSLNLGAVNPQANFLASIHADNSHIGSITAKSWRSDGFSIIRANSIGTITITGDAASGDVGDFEPFVRLVGNNGGTAHVALGTLKIKGSLFSDIDIRDGNITSITAGRSVNSNITMTSTANTVSAGGVVTQGSGNIGSIQAGEALDVVVDAKSLGSFKVVGNAAAGLLGNLESADFILHGTGITTGNALGTFSVAGNAAAVFPNSILVENGSVGTISVARSVGQAGFGMPITVSNGKIGTITAGNWDNSDITARSLGTLKITGAAATSSSPALDGNFNHSSIDTYATSGQAIGTLSVAGNMLFTPGVNFIRADNGIGSFTVKRDVKGDGCVILVNNNGALTSTVGRIGAITAGEWESVAVLANSIGTVKVTGFTDPTLPTPTLINGDLAGSAWTVRGGFQAGTTITGIGTITVAGEFNGNSFFAPSGITALNLTGATATFSSSGSGRIDGGSSIVTQNPLAPALGRIGTVTAKRIDGATFRANTIGAIATTKGPISLQNDDFADQNGNINDADIIATAGTGTAITTISAAGDMSDVQILSPGTVGTIKVAQTMFTDFEPVDDGRSMIIGAGNNIDNLAAGTGRTNTLSAAAIADVDLSTRSLGTVSVTGNANRGIAGNITNSLFTSAGSGAAGNIALGTLTATGAVTGSTFNIARGNVTSFSAARFVGSDLLVGFHMTKAADILAATTSANWTTPALTNFTLGAFKTSGLLDPSMPNPDLTNSASFRDSNVVAGRLGTITLSGSDGNAAVTTLTFGIAFRNTTAGGSAGTLKIAGGAPIGVSASPIPPPLSGSKFFRPNGLVG